MSYHRQFVDQYLRYDPQLRRFRIALWRSEAKPVWLYPSPPVANPNVVNALGGAPTPSAIYSQPYTSFDGADRGLGNPMEITGAVFNDSTVGAAAAAWTVRFRVSGSRKDLMNGPVHVRCFSGVGQTPAVFPEPIWLDSSDTIEAQFASVAAGPYNTRLYFVGKTYYAWAPELQVDAYGRDRLHSLIRRWQRRKQYVLPYWLVPETNPIVLLASGTAQTLLRADDDSQLEMFALMAVSTGPFSYSLEDPQTGASLMNGMVTQVNGVGTANFPAILGVPWLIPGGHRLKLTVTDTSAAPNTVWLTFMCRRIFAPLAQYQDLLQDTQPVPTPADREFRWDGTPFGRP